MLDAAIPLKGQRRPFPFGRRPALSLGFVITLTKTPAKAGLDGPEAILPVRRHWNLVRHKDVVAIPRRQEAEIKEVGGSDLLGRRSTQMPGRRELDVGDALREPRLTGVI